jgi:NitT/TauT family transport system ATP-binding protein
MAQNLLELKHVSKTFHRPGRKDTAALTDVNLSVDQGEFVTLIGPSGCGKSTLLRLIAGLDRPTSGKIIFHDVGAADYVNKRGIVFQEPSLFPWLNVEENIGFGLSVLGKPAAVKDGIISHYIETMGLQDFRKAYPKELSGGMKQRVALARTLATNPDLLLLDEPFGSLDLQTKRFMQDLLLQIWEHERRSIIFITHDVNEAIFLSDTIYVLSVRPATVREKIPIDISRPRTLDTEFSPAFIDATKRLQTLITKESLGLIKLDLEIYKNL